MCVKMTSFASIMYKLNNLGSAIIKLMLPDGQTLAFDWFSMYLPD